MFFELELTVTKIPSLPLFYDTQKLGLILSHADVRAYTAYF